HQLRAYLIITHAGSGWDQDGRIRVAVKFKNIGHTPAHKVRYESAYRIRDVGDSSPSTLSPQEVSALEERRVVFPGLSESQEWREIYGRELWPELRTNTKHVRLWAIVYYEDVFGDEHLTRLSVIGHGH